MALDHSRLGLENQFLENKSDRISFLCSTSLLSKILPTNLAACKPSFLIYFLYITSEVKQYCEALFFLSYRPPKNAVFHNFSRQTALIQYSEEGANGGTQFSVYNYFFGQISVNYYFLVNSQLTTNFG